MAKSLRRLGRGLSSLIPDYRGGTDARDEGDPEDVSRETVSPSAHDGGEAQEPAAIDETPGITGATTNDTTVPHSGTARASELVQGVSQRSGEGAGLNHLDGGNPVLAEGVAKGGPMKRGSAEAGVPLGDTEEGGEGEGRREVTGEEDRGSAGIGRAAGATRAGGRERGSEAGASEGGRTTKRGERSIVPGRGTSESDIALSGEQAVTDGKIGVAEEGVPDGGTHGEDRVSLGSEGRKGSGEGRSAVGLRLREVETRTLKPNRFQPRRMINEESVKRLAQSLESNGMLQPIVARERDGGLEIVAGERRWRAAGLAKLKTVPVIVREANDEQALELALIENIHREDLNPLDRALAYRQYCDAFGLGAENVADKVGEDRTTVVNYLRLLELPKEIKILLVGGRVSMGHARSLLGIRDAGRRVELANMVADGRLSVRALEDVVRREREVRPKPGRRDRAATARVAKTAHIKEMEGRFEEKLGTKVRIYIGRSNTTGRVVIEFFSLDDFDRVTRVIGVKKEE